MLGPGGAAHRYCREETDGGAGAQTPGTHSTLLPASATNGHAARASAGTRRSTNRS